MVERLDRMVIVRPYHTPLNTLSEILYNYIGLRSTERILTLRYAMVVMHKFLECAEHIIRTVESITGQRSMRTLKRFQIVSILLVLLHNLKVRI